METSKVPPPEVVTVVAVLLSVLINDLERWVSSVIGGLLVVLQQKVLIFAKGSEDKNYGGTL